MAESKKAQVKDGAPIAVIPKENSTTLSSEHWVQVAVVSDRKTSMPLNGLVHSILTYTTSPVVFHIFTEHPYAFLDNISQATPYVKVYHYSSVPNIERAKRLIEETKFRTGHASAAPSMSRLFISQAPFQPIGKVPKVIVVDDDILFYRDIAELWQNVTVNQSQISLFCPHDGKRIQRWLINKMHPDDGDVEGQRYCQGGLMALPVASYPGAVNSSQYFWDATFEMQTQYPNASYLLAHQQVLNRMFAKYKATIHTLPCNWHGDIHTCGKPWNCNCQGESYTYHFLNKKYLKKPNMFLEENPRWAFSYYTNVTIDSIVPALNERIREKNGL